MHTELLNDSHTIDTRSETLPVGSLPPPLRDCDVCLSTPKSLLTIFLAIEHN